MPTIQDELLSGRCNGILLPLSAMKNDADWGVGDFGCLEDWVGFFASLGVKFVQILPLQETAPNETCPYSALTAFAVDPVYTCIAQVEDIAASPAAQEYIKNIQGEISVWHNAPKALVRTIKQAKLKALWFGYQYFLKQQQAWDTPRAKAFAAYCAANSSWLRGYSIFRALKEFYKWQSWTQWPEDLKNARPQAVDAFEAQYKEYVQFFAYVQWVLDQQLRRAKAFASSKGVYLFGDIPFGTNLDSAEVWAERQNYRIDYEVGAPADQFSQGGQRWGLPAYDWVYQHTHGLDLWKRKIRRATELYDIFRLDHLVGFYRTYVFGPGDDKGAFDIEGEQNQIDRGYHFLRMVLDVCSGRLPVGEDLGVIPNYVRRMLVDLRIPGYKVLRWEREDNGYYREPRNYPACSLATTSTHDTETVRGWWETMPRQERANIWEMISAQKTDGNIPFTPDVQKAILNRVLTSGSALTLFSWQDIIGTLDRINVPGVVDDTNWTYRCDVTPAQAWERYRPQLEAYRDLLKQTGRRAC